MEFEGFILTYYWIHDHLLLNKLQFEELHMTNHNTRSQSGTDFYLDDHMFQMHWSTTLKNGLLMTFYPP